uniref:Transmembrane protein n=1 Tax=Heterorhabditis bacteriophora TaxID=37862 RepID=A0A1I7WC36_HETBA
MSRLKPLEKLESDYYANEEWRGCIESDDEISSDDELQQELSRLAGIRNENMIRGRISKPCIINDVIIFKDMRHRSEFEDDMEDELDRGIKIYANEHMTTSARPVSDESYKLEQIDDLPPLESENHVEMAGSHEKPDKVRAETITSILSKESPSQVKSDVKKAQVKDDEKNPIKKIAYETEQEMEIDQPDFYDEKEDDDNEDWVQRHRSAITGQNLHSSFLIKNKSNRPRIDNGSDAVLSCPGCMILLTRDCQRHEIYNDQYRAMFVENCKVDETEPLMIEKTGKEKRRLRQKMKKQGLDSSQLKMSLPSAPPIDMPPTYDEASRLNDNQDYIVLYLKFAAAVVLALLNIMPIMMIIVGSLNIHNCMVNSNIPIWLIVAGGCSLFRSAINFYYRFKNQEKRNRPLLIRLLESLVSMFIAVWFILGTVWVYWAYDHVSYNSLDTTNYCDQFTYVFSFVFITVSYAFMILSCFCFCCCCCCVCFRKSIIPAAVVTTLTNTVADTMFRCLHSPGLQETKAVAQIVLPQLPPVTKDFVTCPPIMSTMPLTPQPLFKNHTATLELNGP